MMEVIERLERYGRARNRSVDKEIRIIEITDDEALEILSLLRRDAAGPSPATS